MQDKRTYEKGKTLTFDIGEHTFTTPPMPDKKEMLFYNLPQKDQYWRRQTDFPKTFYEWHRETHTLGRGVELDAEHTAYHPKEGILIALNKEDTLTLFATIEEDKKEGLQSREYRRRTEGVWFFNNGEPTYITGNHYFILQWGAMLGGSNYVERGSLYGQYYQFQRDMGYYYEICRVTDAGRGGIYMKPKKTGATQYFSLLALNEACTHAQKNVRMMSITETLAKDSNFGYIKYAVSKLPDIILPSRAKQNEGEIMFGAPDSARNPLSAKNKRKHDDIYLHTWLCTVPTGRTSFDSLTNHLALIDEWPKIKDSTYPKELLSATLPTVMEGPLVRAGTIFMMSYSPEKTNQSFQEASVIYKESKLKTRARDENGTPIGETRSGLICHTLTVQEGIFGGCDIYGKPVPKLIWDSINAEIKKASEKENSAMEVQIVKRQYPTNENDPWQVAGDPDAVFDFVRISNRIMELADDAARGVLPYVDFNFSYEKAPTKKNIGEEYNFPDRILMEIRTDEDRRAGKDTGKFRWYRREWTPEWFMSKHVNKRIVDERSGLLKPDPNSPFLVCIDPTNYKSKKYTGVGSFNAIMAFILPNAEVNTYVGDNVTNRRLFMEYLFREENPVDTLAAFIQIILYLNCPVLIEGNVPTWGERLIEMGLGHFLLMMNKETKVLEPYSRIREKEQTWFTSQKDTVDLYVNWAKTHLAAPKMPDDIDNLKYMDSERVLMQIGRFKVEDTTQFDAAVAYMEGGMAVDSIMGWRRAQQDRLANRGDKYVPIAAGILR